MSQFYQAQNNQLPVPATQPAFTFDPNIRVNPPAHPSFQNMAEPLLTVVKAAAGGLLDYAQGMANASAARMFFMNMLAANNYQNDVYAETVQMYVEYLVAYSAATGPDPISLIPNTVPDCASLYTAMMVSKYPQVMGYLSPDAQNGINEVLQGANGYFATIDQWGAQGWQKLNQQGQYAQQYGGQQHQMGGGNAPLWGPQTPTTRWGGGVTQNMGGPFGVQNSGGMVRQSNQHLAANSAQMTSLFMNQQQQQHQYPNNQSDNSVVRPSRRQYANRSRYQEGGFPLAKGAKGSSPVAEEITPDGKYHDYRTQEERNRDVVSRSHQATQAPPRQPANTGQAPNASNHPIDPNDPLAHLKQSGRYYDYRRVDTGKHGWVEVIPAYKSPWKPNEPGCPFPYAYNPATHVKFHARFENGGIVKEVIEKKVPEMEYMDNEFDITYRIKGSGTTNQIPPEPNWEALTLMDRFPEKNEEGDYDPDVIRESHFPHELPETFFAESVIGAEFARDCFFAENDLDDTYRKSEHEFDFIRTKPFLDLKPEVASDSILGETLALLSVGDDVTVTSFHHDFVTLKDKIDSRVWHFINDRCTERVNEIFATAMDTSVQDAYIDDFATDWPEIRPGLIADFGEDQGGEMFETFEAFARKRVILGGMYVLVGDELDAYIETHGKAISDNKQLLRDRMVVLAERCSVSQVSWSSSDIPTLLNDTTGVAVLESSHKELYNAMTAIVDRSNKRSRKITHYIRTTDNTTLAIEKGAYNDRYMTLRVVKEA